MSYVHSYKNLWKLVKWFKRSHVVSTDKQAHTKHKYAQAHITWWWWWYMPTFFPYERNAKANWKYCGMTEQIKGVIPLLTIALQVSAGVDETEGGSTTFAFWQYNCMPEAYWAFISCIRREPSSSLNIQSHVLYKMKFSWQSVIHCRIYHVKHHPSETWVMFTLPTQCNTGRPRLLYTTHSWKCVQR